jgi:hypothetical protein
MARLVLYHTRAFEIPASVVPSPLHKVSQRKITSAVREALRKEYGSDRVKVSLATLYRGQMWTGKCRVDGKVFLYRVMSGLYS